MAAPGWMNRAARCAMACLAGWASWLLAAKPGSNATRRARTAPPCTLRATPSFASCSRSRRMVMSETASSSVRSETRTAPLRRSSPRMRSWRSSASTGGSSLQSPNPDRFKHDITRDTSVRRRRGEPVSVSWRAPGRVNLIGEHTDYNDGFALPFAIEQGCTAVVEVRGDDLLRVTSRQQEGVAEARLGELTPGAGGWTGYALGVLWSLAQDGIAVPGLDIELDSDVPIGSGLSSSAALVCSVATAVDDLLGLGLSADELLAVTRRTENDFVGAPTGGMDQLAVLRCTAGHALFCDMRSLATE